MLNFGQSEKNILVAGHRGIAALYPENTMTSFRAAVDADLDSIETDIRLTKDGVAVLMHDDAVDRTTDGHGLVRDYTFKELSKLDAGIHKGEQFKGCRVPMFEEFLELVKPTKMCFMLEIKDYNEQCVDKIVELADKYGILDRSVLTCWDANMTKYTKVRYGLPTLGYPREYMFNGAEDTYEYLDVVAMEMSWLEGGMTRKDIEAVGCDLWAFCPDNEEQTEKCVKARASMITCNNPFPALEYLRRHGLHK